MDYKSIRKVKIIKYEWDWHLAVKMMVVVVDDDGVYNIYLCIYKYITADLSQIVFIWNSTYYQTLTSIKYSYHEFCLSKLD